MIWKYSINYPKKQKQFTQVLDFLKLNTQETKSGSFIKIFCLAKFIFFDFYNVPKYDKGRGMFMEILAINAVVTWRGISSKRYPISAMSAI